MKYCRNTTISHNIAVTHNACLQDINCLIVEEGYSGPVPLFTNTEIVINLDKAEEIVARIDGRLQNKSMDMAFGLTNADSSIRVMLMVEFKFNLKVFYNLKKTDLEGKVAGSTLILSNIPAIHNLFIFIFKTNHIQEAKNRLARMDPKINNNYVTMDIHQLQATYF
jgi:hypothetical protein